jgi:hypothetical protein
MGLSGYEARVLISTCVIACLFHGIGMINSIYKVALEYILSYCASLPVTVESVDVDYGKGIVTVRNIRILVPPVEEDHRWEMEHIIQAKEVIGKVNFGSLLYWLLMSKFGLLVVETVHVKGLTVYIEGFADCQTGSTFYNVWLLGAIIDPPPEPLLPRLPSDAYVYDEDDLACVESIAQAKAFFANTYKNATKSSLSALTNDSQTSLQSGNRENDPAVANVSSSATGEDVVTTSKDSVGDDPDTAAALHNEDEEAETIASSFDQKLAQLKSNVLAYFSSVSPMVQLLEYSGVIYCPCG